MKIAALGVSTFIDIQIPEDSFDLRYQCYHQLPLLLLRLLLLIAT